MYCIFLRIRQEETRTHEMAVNSSLSSKTNTSTEIASTTAWSTETYTHIYGAILALLFVIALTRSITFFRFCATASQNLHDSMFSGLISTTVRFFDLNPSGRIMNRFSKGKLNSIFTLKKYLFFESIIKIIQTSRHFHCRYGKHR